MVTGYPFPQLIIALIVALVLKCPNKSYATKALSKWNRCLKSNAQGFRLFHPAFPFELLHPLSIDDINSISTMKKAVGKPDTDLISAFHAEQQQLPWKLLPEFGLQDDGIIKTTSSMMDLYIKCRHEGDIIWAHVLDRPEPGCLLINHWKKKVIYLAEYHPESGAKGWEISHLEQKGITHIWPPLTLEYEIVDKQWEPVAVSNTLLSPRIIELLPKEMTHALWEIIFLLLISKEREPNITESLFDTGLHPERGLIAYLKIIGRLLERIDTLSSIPESRQIF